MTNEVLGRCNYGLTLKRGGHVNTANYDKTYLRLDGSNSMEADLNLGTNVGINSGQPRFETDTATIKFVDDKLAAYYRLDGSKTLTGDANFGNFGAKNLGDAVEAQDGVNLRRLMSELVPFFKVDGSKKILGNVDFNSFGAKNLSQPETDNDAATKKYVDDNVNKGDFLPLDGSKAMAGNLTFEDGFTGKFPIPQVEADAATKKYVDDNVNKGDFLLRDGSKPMAGNLTFEEGFTAKCPLPQEEADAATKKYVDDNSNKGDFLPRDGSKPMTGDLVLGQSSLSGNFFIKQVATPADTNPDYGVNVKYLKDLGLDKFRNTEESKHFIKGLKTPTDDDDFFAVNVEYIVSKGGNKFRARPNKPGKPGGVELPGVGLSFPPIPGGPTFVPSDPDDATTVRWVMGGFLRVDGTNQMKANLNVANHRVINVGYPILATDAVHKDYVDSHSNFLRVDGSNEMQAALDVGNFRVVNLSPPEAANDAVNKGFLDTFGNNTFLRRDGSFPMTNNLSMGGFQINNLAGPTKHTDGVNKSYVDLHHDWSKDSLGADAFFFVPRCDSHLNTAFRNTPYPPYTITGEDTSPQIDVQLLMPYDHKILVVESYVWDKNGGQASVRTPALADVGWEDSVISMYLDQNASSPLGRSLVIDDLPKGFFWNPSSNPIYPYFIVGQQIDAVNKQSGDVDTQINIPISGDTSETLLRVQVQNRFDNNVTFTVRLLQKTHTFKIENGNPIHQHIGSPFFYTVAVFGHWVQVCFLVLKGGFNWWCFSWTDFGADQQVFPAYAQLPAEVHIVGGRIRGFWLWSLRHFSNRSKEAFGAFTENIFYLAAARTKSAQS